MIRKYQVDGYLDRDLRPRPPGTLADEERHCNTPMEFWEPVVVSLEPGDVLAMRLERTRTTYRATIAAVFRTLADWHARAEARRKREERQARRFTR